MARARSDRTRLWKDRACRLLAENRERTGRLNAAGVARDVGVSRMSVHRLLAELREAHSGHAPNSQP